MNDNDIEKLLLSPENLVLIEAPAGCGKTYQGVKYAIAESKKLPAGRLLILTHTHAACGVFLDRTKTAKDKIEIKTIDSLIILISTVYYRTLGFPNDVSAWARSNNNGFEIAAKKVVELLSQKPFIADSIVKRYPVIVCDEHQDTSNDQHKFILLLFKAGAKLRIFGDPMQALYANTKGKQNLNSKSWSELKALGSFAELEVPHRWENGNIELGLWTLSARKSLIENGFIDLDGKLPKGLSVTIVDNISKSINRFQLDREQRKQIDKEVKTSSQVLILASTNDTVNSLHAGFYRQLTIWEGSSRNALCALVDSLTVKEISEFDVARALVAFICEVCVGFSLSSHGNRLLAEVQEKCVKKASKKPMHIQKMAWCILQMPSHKGVSNSLKLLKELIQKKEAGFQNVYIDYIGEFNDAIKLGQYSDVSTALSELGRRRGFSKPSLPAKCISTIHKVKGLECNHVIVMACDGRHFSDTEYAKKKLYVALSRAKTKLNIVVSSANKTPLIKYSY